jgi:hypothetical protein
MSNTNQHVLQRDPEILPTYQAWKTYIPRFLASANETDDPNELALGGQVLR